MCTGKTSDEIHAVLTSIDIFAIIPKYLENVFLNQIFRYENGEELDQIRTYYNFKTAV